MDGKLLRGSHDRALGADGQPLDKRAEQQVCAMDLASGLVIGQRGLSGLTDEVAGVTLRVPATQPQPGTCLIADVLHTDRTATDPAKALRAGDLDPVGGAIRRAGEVAGGDEPFGEQHGSRVQAQSLARQLAQA